MRRRALLLATAALPFCAIAQGPRRPRRVGVIHYSATYFPVVEGLRIGLKELGVIEGRHVVLDIRDAKGDPKAIERLARAFESQKADLIYSVPTSATTVVKRATHAIPVVFSVGFDPIATGLVEGYSRPGGRLTGVHYLTGDLTAKRLELLKDLLPKLSRVVTVYNPGNPAARESSRLARAAGEKLGVRLIERHAASETEMRAALDALKPGEADALFLVSDAMVTGRWNIVAARARALKLPTMAYEQSLAEQGALVSYGVDIREVGRQSAKYVQRVLDGASPADLPVENVTRLSFVLNRRTAREIGVIVPPAMLVRFDRVIE
jgi:putative ABC transport system substrate-binding protein